MSQPPLMKAVLQEITLGEDSANQTPIREVHVQFNPETLKVAFSNQIANSGQSGGSAIQFSGRGSTKLSFDLWFDITDPNINETYRDKTDVREITKEVADFMKTEASGSGRNTQYVPPGVRFLWGRFLFEGVMVSINETLDYFSEDGKPLRANISVSLTKQEVDVKFGDQSAGTAAASGTETAGTQPMESARQDESLQQAAARNGQADQWQDQALANQIENPRHIEAGAPLNFNRPSSGSISWP